MTENEKTEGEPAKQVERAPITFAEFLEGVPPAQLCQISDLYEKKWNSGGSAYCELKTPPLQLHCTSEACNGTRTFRVSSSGAIAFSDTASKFVVYICSNCRRTSKTFSLFIIPDDVMSGEGAAWKYGENPVYGPPTPARLIRMFGKDRDLFLSGRRCENQGLGIGAFTYYRRVVESHKNSIFDEIIRVSQKLGVETGVIDTLKSARDENQFSKAMTAVKDAIPQALLVNGHNPITLLHTALSAGLHAKTDEECLELAQAARIILTELADRLGQALKDEAELSNAVNRLLQARKDQE